MNVNKQEGFSDPSVPSLPIEDEEEEIQTEEKQSNVYIDLQAPENTLIKEKIVKENFPYASYLYIGVADRSSKQGILLSTSNKISKINGVLSLSKAQQNQFLFNYNDYIHKIDSLLKGPDFGFQLDHKGNYYNTETGIVFNLVYDHQKNEMIVCYVGLNYQDQIETSEDQKDQLRAASFQTAMSDMMGSLPLGVRQCINIGKMVKNALRGTGITPVVVGHSHGGGLAQATALANNLKGVIINSRPLGDATRAFIGEGVINENAKNITGFSVRGDWLTEAKTIEDFKPAFETTLKTNIVAAVFFEMIKNQRIPSNVGIGYQLPRPEGADAIEAHRRFHEAFEILRDRKVRHLG